MRDYDAIYNDSRDRAFYAQFDRMEKPTTAMPADITIGKFLGLYRTKICPSSHEWWESYPQTDALMAHLNDIERDQEFPRRPFNLWLVATNPLKAALADWIARNLKDKAAVYRVMQSGTLSRDAVEAAKARFPHVMRIRDF